MIIDWVPDKVPVARHSLVDCAPSILSRAAAQLFRLADSDRLLESAALNASSNVVAKAVYGVINSPTDKMEAMAVRWIFVCIINCFHMLLIAGIPLPMIVLKYKFALCSKFVK